MPYTTNVAGTTITAAWGNANVRDQVVTPFANVAARTSAITVPVDGMLASMTDADVVDYYDGAAWSPIGPNVADALKITTAPPFVATTSFSAEAEVSSKFRLTLPVVRAGELWALFYTFMYNQSATGSDWTFKVREDTAAGTVIQVGYLANVGTNINQFTLPVLWAPSGAATSKVIVCTAVRNGGAQTLNIWNNTATDGANCVFAMRVGKGSLFRSVA